MKKQLWMSLVLLIIVAAIVVACASAEQPTQVPVIPAPVVQPTEPQAEASNATPLLFLGNQNIAPVVYLDGATPTGVAVDIVHALANHMPHPIEIRAMNWPDAQAMVARGDADALIQINPTEERKKIYDFSDPLLESHFSIFTRADRMGISGLSSLRGLRVGVEKGGLPQRLLEKDPQVQLIIIPNFTDGFRQLNEGSVDTVIVDYRVGSYILAVNNIRNIRISGEPIESSYSSIAVKKGNTQLLNEINTALHIIRTDGTYEKIIEKWQPTEAVFETQAQITARNYLYTILMLLLLFLIAGIWMVTIKKELNRRKTAEETMREQYSTLRGIIDSANALIFSVDRHYRYTSFNKGHAATMKTIYGAEIELGHSILEYMTVAEDRETARHNLDRALAGEQLVEEAYSGEELRSRKYFQVSHSPIRTDGEIIGVAVLAQDITERKRAEEEITATEEELRENFEELLKSQQELRETQDELVRKEKLAVLGKLSGGVAHELRNPLGTIKNATYFLNVALKNPDDEVKDTIEIINTEIARSENIISSLLDFARPKVPVQKKVSVNTVLKEAISRYNIPKNVTVINNSDQNIQDIRADPDKLMQVFGNLITNACEAMPDGGTLTIASENTGPDTVAVTVKDTGTGIAEEHMKKMFEPLFTTKTKGIGLGLVVSDIIIKSHGGRIDIQSIPGKETVFTVILPVSGKGDA